MSDPLPAPSAPPPAPPALAAVGRGARTLRRPALLVAALFAVSLDLRAPMSVVPPLLGDIQDDTGLSATAAGALTALPVLLMGLLAPPAHRLAHRVGREAAALLALVALTIGLLVRGAGDPGAVFAGTFLAGLGIAVAGVVLPGVVKEYFPHRAGAVTGLYLTAMMLGAAIASATAVPLADRLGSWEAVLAGWALVGAVGIAAWGPVAWRLNERESLTESRPGLPWRSTTAWLVAAYLAVQSTLFYSQLAWISPAYEDIGWSAEDAGLLLAAFMVVQLVAALVVPVLSDRSPDRRPWFALVTALSALGIAALLWWPSTLPWLFVSLLGFGQGGGFALGLVLLVDYASDAAGSSRLTAMAFLVAYTVAAAGPVAVGGLRDLTGTLEAGWAALLVLAGVQAVLVTRFTAARRARPV